MCLYVYYLCVCNIWIDVKLLYIAGGSGPLMSPLPTKLLMGWEDIGTDHPDVPAEFVHLRLTWQGAKPRTPTTMILFLLIQLHVRGEGIQFPTDLFNDPFLV